MPLGWYGLVFFLTLRHLAGKIQTVITNLLGLVDNSNRQFLFLDFAAYTNRDNMLRSNRMFEAKNNQDLYVR